MPHVHLIFGHAVSISCLVYNCGCVRKCAPHFDIRASNVVKRGGTEYRVVKWSNHSRLPPTSSRCAHGSARRLSASCSCAILGTKRVKLWLGQPGLVVAPAQPLQGYAWKREASVGCREVRRAGAGYRQHLITSMELLGSSVRAAFLGGGARLERTAGGRGASAASELWWRTG